MEALEGKPSREIYILLIKKNGIKKILLAVDDESPYELYDKMIEARLEKTDLHLVQEITDSGYKEAIFASTETGLHSSIIVEKENEEHRTMIDELNRTLPHRVLLLPKYRKNAF